MQLGLLTRQTKVMVGLLAALLLFSPWSSAENIKCSSEQTAKGEVHGIVGTKINLRSGPGTEYEKVVDPKATEKKGSEQYAMLSTGHLVRVNCRQGKWSQVDTLSPDWLRKTHRGWVLSRYLKK